METSELARSKLTELLSHFTGKIKHIPTEYNPKKSPDWETGLNCIRWEVSFYHAKQAMDKPPAMVIPFYQGIGHLKKRLGIKPLTLHTVEIIKLALAGNRGEYVAGEYVAGVSYLSPPLMSDVLACMVSDADCLESTFEQWAGDYGYDVDSRKAENIYKKCLEQSQLLLSLVGLSGLETLRQNREELESMDYRGWVSIQPKGVTYEN